MFGRILSSRDTTQVKNFHALNSIVEQRLEYQSRESAGHLSPDRPVSLPPQGMVLDASNDEQNDCIQWIIDTSPKENPWSAKRIVHEVMAIWFGALHALSMVGHVDLLL